jgi:hypothetical protein
MTEANDPGLAAITDALRSLPLEDRVPGYGATGMAAGNWVELIDRSDGTEGGYCPRGVAGCVGAFCEWQCLDCDCVNCHEPFCYQCGAARPDEEA